MFGEHVFSITFLINLFLLQVEGVEVILNTAQGKLRGVRSKDGSHDSYNGIPYAGKVNQNSRFKRAPPPTSWTGLREAITPGISCLSAPGGKIQGDEDCLFLNVHVPLRSKSEPLFPVMAWVHGGGFNSGSGSPNLYGPSRFMRHKIILITLNYRLGALGFLCLGHEKIPGNAGVKDVVMALRWVRDNIIAFGGDPARVTVAGQGTGAAMVDALTFSEMANGLYHRIIAQSGSALSPWAFNYDSRARAYGLGQFFANSSELDDIVSALIDTKGKELILASRNIKYTYFPFALCAENAHKREERFINGYPLDLLNEKRFQRVPYMTGFNSNEGLIFASLYKKFKKRENKFILPEEFAHLTRNEKNDLRIKIKQNYFDDGFDLRKYQTYFRDVYFLNHIYRNVLLRVQEHPVFFYELDFATDDILAGSKNLTSGHGEELKLLFSNDDKDIAGSDTMVDRLTSLWSNFVKHGNPTPNAHDSIVWRPTSKEDPQLLKIGENLEMQTFHSHQKMLFWNELYDNFYYRRAKHENR